MSIEAKQTQAEKAVALLAERGVMRPSEFIAEGVHHETLARLLDEGVLSRPVRGIYRLVNAETEATHNLAEVAKRAPKGVVCLVSALQFHELTLQIPRRIWVAIGYKDREPKIDYPPVRYVRFNEKKLGLGVETHMIDRVCVKIYSPAKTVADCFRLRGKVGVNVAIEGLQNALRDRKATPDEIARFAKETRIWTVLRPYLETAVADEA